MLVHFNAFTCFGIENMFAYIELAIKTGFKVQCTVELQWLEHLSDYENVFATGVVRAIEDL